MSTTTVLTTVPATAVADPQTEPADHWLVEQLHAERSAADRQRLSALLAAHPLPRQRR